MHKIVITGIGRLYDGSYDFDGSYFTNKELHTIKRMAGIRAGEMDAAFAAGDNDLVVAIAAIALERNGKDFHEDALWNAKVGCIEAIMDAEEDADPPTPGPEESLSDEKPSSGPPSPDDSDLPENGQSRTGLQPSELSAA
jgi:hypothetical protein